MLAQHCVSAEPMVAYRHLGFERVYLLLYKVANTNFISKGTV